MGDRVLLQCWNSGTGKFGPVVYGHWLGEQAPQIVAALRARMELARPGDLDYNSARLVQTACALTAAGSTTGVGLWNTDHLLTAADSHGDAGCVLIDVGVVPYAVQYLGGYLRAPEQPKEVTTP